MGFFNPWFLVAGLAIAVPIFLHLVYRQESKTYTFPAIWYLLQTESDHTRQIQTQQLLLLLLRLAIVATIVALGARLYLPGPGGSHNPTALALVIDNSMSATLVQDGRRTLDTLKAVARMSIASASLDDVIWVVRAGTPWQPSVPGDISDALRAINETHASHAHGDLTQAVARARALVGQSPLPEREVHVFSDLQATAFSDSDGGDPDIDVVVYAAPATFLDNRAVASVSVGGGLSPLAGDRTEVDVAVAGGTSGEMIGVRLYANGQMRAAATATPDATLRLGLGPFPPGLLHGHVDIDSDPLTADDRRYFTVSIRDPEPVALVGPASLFVREALAVLEESGRVSLDTPARAHTVIGIGGEGVDQRSNGQNLIVFPSADPALLPALNRRLAAADIPYRYAVGPGSEARIGRTEVAIPLEGLMVHRYYSLLGAGGGTATVGAQSGAATLITLSTGDPWLIAGSDAAGSYILFASSLDEESSDVPLSATMVPLFNWAIERGMVGREGSREISAGSSVRPSPRATAVLTPEGDQVAIDGDQPFRATAKAGLYRVLSGDSVLEQIAVNPPTAESDLAPATPAQVERDLGGDVTVVDDASSWTQRIFRASRGPEPWHWLAALLLILLMAESLTAASGSPLLSRIRARP